MVAYLAGATLLLHLLTSGRYGYFRDELYYLACGEHLDWGYVDHPPLIALVAAFSRWLLGDSLRAIRFFPGLAGALLVVLAGLIARELGGGRFAQALAAIAVVVAPIYLAMGYLLTMNAFEPLFWMGSAYVFILIVKRDNPKLWLWFGLLAGLGLQNKDSMLMFGLGVFLGLLLTRERRFLAQKWVWIAGGVSFLILLPNLVWNIHNHFPFIELMRNIRASGRDIQFSPGQFLWQQALLVHPLTFPICLAGLWFFFSSRGKPYRVLGWTFLVVLGTVFALHGKNYYASPAYPMLLAAGAVVTETAARRLEMRSAIVTVLVVTGALQAPLVLPVLPVESLIRYLDAFPVKVPRVERSHVAALLPQHYADQFGWEEMTAAVARIYNSLPPEDRVKTAIVGNNYGESGAIDFFGKKYGLPKSIGVHQSYFLWGPRHYHGEVLIVLGDRREGLAPKCDHVSVGAVLNHPYAIPWENGEVLVCRGLKWDLQKVWRQVKKWD